ncbi:hypothetical protein FKM82_005873, partial [Ascaphus truei]
MASNSILIKGGKIVNGDCSRFADVYIEDGLVKDIGENLQQAHFIDVRVIDATGKLVIPGGIDTHTHMQFPFMGTYAVDDFYIGTK